MGVLSSGPGSAPGTALVRPILPAADDRAARRHPAGGADRRIARSAEPRDDLFGTLPNPGRL
jgi:hypothetical protein